MKRKLFLTLITVAVTVTAFAQFTAGNLAVYRYGDGTALTNNGRVKVFVDEYNLSGAIINTYTVPQTASGSNYGLEGLGLTGGAYAAEGFPVLSRDGSTMSFIGYNPATSGQYVIGTINAAGSILTTTLVVDAIGSPRSAVVDGTAVYYNGFQNGVNYKTLGTIIAGTRVSAGQNAPRVLTIAETVINSLAGIKIFAPDAQNNFGFADLPTTSTTFSTLGLGGAATVTAHQVLALKSLTNPARTILYVIDDNSGSPLIRKYRSNGSGTDWVALGTLSVPSGTKSISGTINSTGVKIYYTTLGTPGNTNSQLLTYTDVFTSTNEDSKSITGGSGTLLATAPANTVFRGVTMAPGTSVLPVDLLSFDGKEVGKTIQLNWATASESNSSHFEVLKSFDGKTFNKIGEVKAATNSSAKLNYAFTDENPISGTNYYQLKQVDNDGKFVTYAPIFVNSSLEKTSFNVYASSANTSADLFIYSTIKQIGSVKFVDLTGKTVTQQSVSLDKGFSKITIPVNQNNGIQIAVLTVEGKEIVQKFIWQ
jgi:hypothetical protein